MMSNCSLSIIILSFQPHIDKGNCIRHCIASIFNQDFKDFEVIIVENSVLKNDLEALEVFIEYHNRSGIHYKILNLGESISRGAARNEGAKHANGRTLVFLDDDTIILTENALRVISINSKTFDYGCGANRYWTKKKWSLNSEVSLQNILKKNTKYINSHKFEAPNFVRGEEDASAEAVTFLGNFGYCNTKVFFEIGGFPDFERSSFEDDFLILKLGEAGYKFFRLSEIDVLHVSHRVSTKKHKDSIRYYEEIGKHGYLGFDTVRFISEDVDFKSVVKKTINYEKVVVDIYCKYLNTIPLNLEEDSFLLLDSWRKKQQLEIQDFSILLNSLINSSTLEEFIIKNSIDFDNLAPLLESTILSGFIVISDDGQIYPREKIRVKKSQSKVKSSNFLPDSQLNQFPCTSESLSNRLDLLRKRYPLCNSLSLGIIGDDDLFTAKILKEEWINPTVLEKDQRILNYLKGISDRLELFEIDFRDFREIDNLFTISKVDTFICDPPYTINGCLLFIYVGLNILKINDEIKEFYLIANRTMLGKDFFTLQKILAECDIFLYDCQKSNSSYHFPKHFSENKRASDFFEKMKIKRSIATSSTSDLFIFRTVRPNITLLKKRINTMHIYDHLQ